MDVNTNSSHILIVGTTWLQEIIWRILNKSSQESHLTVWDKVPNIEAVLPGSDANCFDEVQKMKSPRFFKSHLPVWFFEEKLKRSKCKCIIIMRNPKDMLVSFYHFIKAIWPPSLGFEWHDWYEKFSSKTIVYGDWFDHVNGWWNLKHLPNVFIIKYENMKQDHLGSIEKVAEFLNVSCSRNEINLIKSKTTFDSMKSDTKTNLETVIKGNLFIRKGVIGDWTNYFTSEQNEHIEERIKNELKATGLTFQFK